MKETTQGQAILIGCTEYKSSLEQQYTLSPLRCPIRDVEGMNILLSEFGDVSIKTLGNETESHTAQEQINNTISEANKHGGVVLIYYSGHGVLASNDLFLAMKNTTNEISVLNAISVKAINDYIANHKIRSKVALILDCCFSGAADDFLGGTNVNILTASSRIDIAKERPGDQYSLFTKHIMIGVWEGDADINSDGKISLSELYEYVTKKIESDSSQKPRSIIRDGGIVFARTRRRSNTSYTVLNEFLKSKRHYLPTSVYDAAEQYIQDRYTPYYKEVLRFFQIPLTPGEFLDRWITIKCDKSFTWFKEKLANTSLEMILIPKQDANLEDFLLSKHQITQAIWQDVMGTSPSYFKGGSLPVEDISWIAAVEFCQKLSTLTNKQYRLPTQSEWEYACKIGGVSDETTQLENVAWYCKNASGTTHSVGQREPSTFGLCDLLGNVFEMCSDNITMDNLNIEEGEIEQPDRVARGGAWDQDEDSCKISYRRFIRKNVGYKNVGFRVAISRASLSSEHTSASHKCDCCCQY